MPFMADRRLRYVQSKAVGKGAALNEGLGLAHGGIVVCTDDDCDTPPGWVVGMADILDAHPRVAVAFCNVLAAPHDRSAGYIPAYERRTDRVLTSVLQVRHGIGLGAGMALRRGAVLAFGGFDEAFGPGSRFRSGDDWDISVRALLNGWHVFDTAGHAVRHHGYRTFAEGKDHAWRDWVGIGALFGKPLRAGRLSVAIPALYQFAVYAVWPPIAAVLRGRPPSGWARIAGFARGFLEGVSTPTDRKTVAFRPAARTGLPRSSR
jgi:GT2 family glycosyltransferase